MRKDEWVIVDGVLRDFPAINRDKVRLEEYLQSLALSMPSGAEALTSGGVSMFEQDRYLGIVDNKRLKLLQRIVASVYGGFKSLPEIERRLISLWCFEDLQLEQVINNLHISRRQAFRIKSMAYHNMRDYCINAYEDVRRWRDSADEEIANCLMPLLRKSREGIAV